MRGKYKIAGKVIEIISLHREVHDYCHGYSFGGAADFTVETSQADIYDERERNFRAAELEGRRP